MSTGFVFALVLGVVCALPVGFAAGWAWRGRKRWVA